MLLASPHAAALSVLTQNIRMQHPQTAPGQADHWGDRAPVLRDLLRRADADVVGTQEVTWPQLPVLEEALGSTHLRLGFGREGGARGEHCLLHLRRDRFEVQDWDQFWLSPTPATIGSVGWDAHITRVAVWARVRDHAADAELVLAVTHLDHAGELARAQSAELIADRLREVAGDAAPIVLMGDFNAAAGDSVPWRLLTDAGFVDAHDAAEHIAGEDIGTYTDYGPAVPGGQRIDWIMARGLRVHAYAAHDHVIDGVHASDHAGVQAIVEVAPSA